VSRSQRFWWILCAALLWLPQSHAYQAEQNGLPVIAMAGLPAEARDTLRAIKRVPGQKFFVQGGPFTYPRDGVVFKNFERILPKQPRGYYHEYTVKTPGVHNRGARRIISGDVNEYYYSANHYKSFKRIWE